MVKLCAKSPGVDLNVSNTEDKTALILAIEKGDAEILDALLPEGVDSDIDIAHKDVSFTRALNM